MNRIYKLIFNKRTQELEVASELATNTCCQSKSVTISEISEDLAVVDTEPALTHLPTTLRTQYKFKNFMPSASHRSYRNYATTVKFPSSQALNSSKLINTSEQQNYLVPSVLSHALTRITLSNISQTLSTMGSTLAVASSMVAGLEATTVTTAIADTIHGTAGSIGTVVSGQVSANTQGLITTIKNSPNAIINWQSFNINENELLKFVQQSQSSTVLNRVLGKQVSNILGSLQSNGHVFLINPNGIVFGKNSQVNVGGLVASTLNIKNDDFVHGRYVFNKSKDQQITAVLNQGMISVSDFGHITLIGGQVVNNGVLKAVGGTVYLLAGNSIEISDLNNNPQISYKVTAKNKAVNLNTIIARNVALVGNKALNGPSSASEFTDIVGANNGDVKAKISASGQVVLFGGSEAEQMQSTIQTNKQVKGKRTGLVVNNGVINVSSRQGKAGSIKILGDYVVLDQHSALYAEGLGMSKTSKSYETNVAKTRTSSVQGAKLAKPSVTSTDTTNNAITDATNDSLTDLSILDDSTKDQTATKIKIKTTKASFVSGGDILVGGDSAGKGSVKLAQVTVLDPNSHVFIGAKGEQNSGNAGHFISWGDVSSVAGNIDASAVLGNGGFIETSAKRLDVSPRLNLDLSTKHKQSQAGNWLLDPYEFFIIGKDWADAHYDQFEQYLADHNIIANQGSVESSWGNLFGSNGHSAVIYYVELNKAYKAKYVNSWAYDNDFLNIAKGNAKSNKPATIEIQANSVVYYQARLDIGKYNVSLYSNITNTQPNEHKRRELINDNSSTGGNGLFVIGSIINVANSVNNKGTFGLDDNSLGSVNITDSTIQGSIRYHLIKEDINSTFILHNSTLNLNNLIVNLDKVEDQNSSFGSSDTTPDSYAGGESKRQIHFNISDSKIFYHNNVYIGHANDVTITNTTFTNLRYDTFLPSNLYINGVNVNISKSNFFTDSQAENHSVLINTVNDLNVKDSIFTVNTTTPNAVGVEFTSSSNDYIKSGDNNLPTYKIQSYEVNLQTHLNLTNVVFQNQTDLPNIGGVKLQTFYNPKTFSRSSFINVNNVTYNLGYFGFGGNNEDSSTVINIVNSNFTHLTDLDNTIGGQTNRQFINIENTPITIISNSLDSYFLNSAQLNISNSTIKINPEGTRGFSYDQRLHTTGFNSRLITFNNVTIDTNNSLNIISLRIADGTLTQQSNPNRNARLQLTDTKLISRQGGVFVDAYNDNVSLVNTTIEAKSSAKILAQNSLFFNQGIVNSTLGLVNFTAYQNLHLDHLTVNAGSGIVVLGAHKSELNQAHPFGFPNNNLTIANTSFNIVKPILKDNDSSWYDDINEDNNQPLVPTPYGNLGPISDESSYRPRSFSLNDVADPVRSTYHSSYRSSYDNPEPKTLVLIQSNNISLYNVSSSGEDSYKVTAGDSLYIQKGSYNNIQSAKLLGVNAVHVKDLDIHTVKNASILNLKTHGNVTVDSTNLVSDSGSVNLVSFTDLTVTNSKFKANTGRLGLVANNSIAIADSNLSAGVLLATIKEAGSFVSHNSNYTGVINDQNTETTGYVSIQGVTKQQLASDLNQITKASLSDLNYPNLDNAAIDQNSDLAYIQDPNAPHNDQPQDRASVASLESEGGLGNFDNGGVLGDNSGIGSDTSSDASNIDSDYDLSDLNQDTDSTDSYLPKSTHNGLVYFDRGQVDVANSFRVASSKLDAKGITVKAYKYGVLLGSSGDIKVSNSEFKLSNLDQGKGLGISSTGLTGTTADHVTDTQITLDHVQVYSSENTNTSFVGVIGSHLDTVKLIDTNLTTKGSIFINPAKHINLTNSNLRSYSDQIQLGQTSNLKARDYFENHGNKYYLPIPVDGSTYLNLEQVGTNQPDSVINDVVTEELILNNTSVVSLIPDATEITHVHGQVTSDGISLVSNHTIDLTNNSNLTSESNIILNAGDNVIAKDYLVLNTSVINATRGKVQVKGSDLTVDSTDIRANHTVKLLASATNLNISNSKVLTEEDDIRLVATQGQVKITNYSEVSTIDPQVLHKIGMSNGSNVTISSHKDLEITDSCISTTCNFSTSAQTGITIKSSELKAGCNQDLTTTQGNILVNLTQISAGYSPVTGENFADSIGFSNTSMHVHTGAGLVTLNNSNVKVASQISVVATKGIVVANTSLTSDSVDLSAGLSDLALTTNSQIITNHSTTLVSKTKVALDHVLVKAKGIQANISVKTPRLTVDTANLLASHYVNMTNTNGQDLNLIHSKVYGQAGIGINSKNSIKLVGTNLTSVNIINLNTPKVLTLINSNVTAVSTIKPELGLADPQLGSTTTAHSVNLHANQKLITRRTNVSAKDINLNTKDLMVNQDSVLTSSHDLLALNSKNINIDNVILSVGHNATLVATDRFIIANHSLVSSDELTLKSHQDITVSNASVHSINGLNIISKHDILVDKYADLDSSANLSLTIGNNLTINNHSLVIATNNLSIQAANTLVDNNSQAYSKNANLVIATTADTIVNNNSIVKAKQDLKVGSGHDLTISQDSNIYAVHNTEVVSSNTTKIMHNSQLAGYVDVTVKSGTINLVTDNSSIVSGGKALISSTDTMVYNNSIIVSQDLTRITSTNNLVVDNSKIGSYKDVLINTGNKTVLTNGSYVQAINSTTINSGNTEISQGSTVTSNKDVDILTSANSNILDHSHVQGIQRVNINSKGNTNIESGSTVLSTKNITIHSGKTTTINKDSTVGAQKTSINSDVDTIISASKVIADSLDLGANANLDISSHSVLEAKDKVNTVGGNNISIKESTIHAGISISANSTDNLSVTDSTLNAGKEINFKSKQNKIGLNGSEVASGCNINVESDKDANINTSKLSAPCNSNIHSSHGNVYINHVVLDTHHDHYIDKTNAKVTIESDNGGVSINNSDLTTPNQVVIDSSNGTTISNTTIDTDKNQGSIIVIGGFTNGGGNTFNSPEIIGATINDPSKTIAPIVNPLILNQPNVPSVPKSTETVIVPPAIALIHPPVIAPVKPKYHYEDNFIYDFTYADVFSGGGNSFISSDGASAPYDGSALPNVRVLVLVNPDVEESTEITQRNKNRISPILHINSTSYDELGVHIYYSDLGLDAGIIIKPSSITVASAIDDGDFNASCKVEIGKVLSKHGLNQANLNDLSSLSDTKLSRSEIQSIARCISQTGGNTNTQTPDHNIVKTTLAHSLEVQSNSSIVHHYEHKPTTKTDIKVHTTEHTPISTDLTVESKLDHYYKESYRSYVTIDKITYQALPIESNSKVKVDTLLSSNTSYHVKSSSIVDDEYVVVDNTDTE